MVHAWPCCGSEQVVPKKDVKKDLQYCCNYPCASFVYFNKLVQTKEITFTLVYLMHQWPTTICHLSRRYLATWMQAASFLELQPRRVNYICDQWEKMCGAPIMFALLGSTPQALVLLDVAKLSIWLLNRIPVEGDLTFDPHTVFI